MRTTVVIASLLLALSPATAQTPTAHQAAVELDARLRASLSATATLRDWCDFYGVADPTIHAELVKGPARAASARQRRELRVSASEPLGYRHVRLSCGGHVLSEAENWFVPSRLTPAMNASLATSDTPFGTVVAPLHISRRNLAADMLWRHEATPPPQLFRHRALVLDAAGRPIAEVIETYQREAAELRYRNPAARSRERKRSDSIVGSVR
jgi:chorismate-pyruvate lyase